MGVCIFLSFMFLAMFSGSSTQISKPSIFQPEGNQEPQLFLEKKNDLNPPSKQGGSYGQGKPGTLSLQGQPGYSNQPGKPRYFNQYERPEVLNQPGMSKAWILKGNSGEYNQKGNTEASNEQGNSGSFHHAGKPGSSSQPGKPGSSSQQGKPGSSSQQGKPGSSSQPGKPGASSQPGKPGASSQHRQSRSFDNQEERKDVEGPLNGNIKKTQAGSTISKIPVRNAKCPSVFKPVCGSDGKTYGNRCVFNEAKRLSKGKLNLNHEGKC